MSTPKKRSPLGIVLLTLLGIFAAAIGFVVFSFFFLAPSITEFEARSLRESSLILDRSGQHIFYEIFGEENRQVLPQSDIPGYVQLAIIAIEDEAFYTHFGVDIPGVFRSLGVNLASGSLEQGGSTITQQLARSVLPSKEKTLSRKFIELLMAFKLELTYTKDQILTKYLNQVPFGSNAYGIEAAARTFFGKHASELSLGESCLLAALPNAPSLFSPYGEHSDLLFQRQVHIINKLYEKSWISLDEALAALRENALGKVVPLKRRIEAPHFVFYILEALEKRYSRKFLETAGLRIYTTVDFDMQRRIERVVDSYKQANLAMGATNTAVVALDASRAQILAMVGSADYFDPAIDGQVNMATSPRQTGSAFKPLVYAQAFEKGFQPETILFDVPIDFGLDNSGIAYKPSNYNKRLRGIVTMRQALIGSMNIPAVQTQYLAGLERTYNALEKMGISTLKDRNRIGLSLVLGSGEVSLLEMTNAYAVFSRKGWYAPASGILRIEDAEGAILYEPESYEERVISEQSALKIAGVLSDFRTRAFYYGADDPLSFEAGGVAAKTGTTQDYRDAWTLGFTNRVALGVWVGNSDGTLMYPRSDGIRLAAPIWRDSLEILLASYPVTPFAPYTKINSTKFLLTGRLPPKLTPPRQEKRTKAEYHRRFAELTKAAQAGILHSILYYVNREDPLGSTPPDRDDPMLARFETALRTPVPPESIETEDLVMDALESDRLVRRPVGLSLPAWQFLLPR